MTLRLNDDDLTRVTLALSKTKDPGDLAVLHKIEDQIRSSPPDDDDEEEEEDEEDYE